MFSVITSIYNKKTQRTYLKWNCSHPQENWKSIFFWQLEMFDVWHGTHRYDIPVLATNASTCFHRYSSLLQWSVLFGERGHVAMLRCVICTKCTLHSNHRLTVWYSNTQNDFSHGAAIFSLHTHASPSGRNVNYGGKQLTGQKIFELFLLSVQVS